MADSSRAFAITLPGETAGCKVGWWDRWAGVFFNFVHEMAITVCDGRGKEALHVFDLAAE
jgi:hypothetical protein